MISEANRLFQETKDLEEHLLKSLTPQNATFDNLLLPLCLNELTGSIILGPLYILANLSPDPALRNASYQMQEVLAEKGAKKESFTRGRSIAELITAVWERHQNGTDALEGEKAYKLLRTQQGNQNSRAGIQDEKKRERHDKAIEKEKKLKTAVGRTIAEANRSYLWLARDELIGMPADALNGMETSKNGTKLKVSFKSSQYAMSMRHVQVAQTRKKLYMAATSQFPENVEKLQQLIALRDETAKLVGFNSHAEWRMQSMMASGVDSVVERLEDIKAKLRGPRDDAAAKLVTLKKSFIKKQRGNDTFDPADEGRLNAWDVSFYTRMREDKELTLKLAEYFEAKTTLDGMLKIFGELFGMRFVAQKIPTWHEDVTSYSAWNSKAEGGEFLGYLFFDLYAREGKSQGAYASNFQPVSSLPLNFWFCRPRGETRGVRQREFKY